MATAPLDQNSRQGLIAASSAGDGAIVALYADPTSHRLLTQVNATSGSATGQTTTNANVAQFTVGASDASFWVSANANCTAFTSGTLNVNVAYTDETNAAHTIPFQGHFGSGYGTGITATGSFEGQPLHIRAKAGTTITITTSGTFTLTYDVYGSITQIT